MHLIMRVEAVVDAYKDLQLHWVLTGAFHPRGALVGILARAKF